MKNSEYFASVTESDNLYEVRSTYLVTEPQIDSFAYKQEALDFADDLVKIGKVTSVEITRVIRVNLKMSTSL